MRLVFITRKYPPSIGGMENVSYHLSRELDKQTPTYTIAWGKSQKYLPYFLCKALVLAVWHVGLHDDTNIHIGDGVLAPLGLLLKFLTGCKVSVTVHGLDITYKSRFYQWLVPHCLKRLDKIVCISNATLQECIERGIPSSKCAVIGWGVDTKVWHSKATRKDLEKYLKVSLDKKKVLVTVGRMVPRKGVAWFIDNVMSKLGTGYIYLVVGDGADKPNIEKAISKHKLNKLVLLVGRLSDEELKMIYKAADIFLMPNIPIQGDMEGFGTVALEAAASGLPTLASNLEGIADAVIEGKTGRLCEPLKSGSFIEALNIKMPSRDTVYKNCVELFSWQSTAKAYEAFISE
jgi:glycosyltransferase involved in cell wall biosynthesis